MRKGLKGSIILGLLLATAGYIDGVEAAAYTTTTTVASGTTQNFDGDSWVVNGTSINVLGTSTIDNGTITSTGGEAAVYVHGGGNVTISNSTITANNARSGAIYINGSNSRGTVENVIIYDNRSDNSTIPSNIHVLSNAHLDIKGTNILYCNAPRAEGIKVRDKSSADLYGTTTINVIASNYTAHQGVEIDNGSTFDVHGHLIINRDDTQGVTNNQCLYLGYDGGYLGTKSTLTVDPTGILTINNKSKSSGIDIMRDGVIMNKGTVDVDCSADNGNCIRVTSDGELTSTGTIIISSTGAATSGLNVVDRAKATLDGIIDIQVPNGDALYASGTANAININQAGSGKVTIAGDIVNETNANNVINLTLDTTESYFTGASSTNGVGTTNIYLDNSAPWNVTADSRLTALDLGSTGVLNMHNTGAGSYETVTAKTFNSNEAGIIMTTDLQTSKDSYDVTKNSDKLVIEGTSSGNAVITIKDTSLENGTAAEGYLLLVEDKTSGGATFTGTVLNKGGIYKYTPIITDVNPEDNTDVENASQYTGYDNTNAKNWYLTGFETKKIDETPIEEVVQPQVIPSVASHAERYVSYWRQLDNLLLRLGELRDNDNSNGIWARVKTARESVSSIGLDDDRWSMYQVGYDHKYKDDDKKGRKYWGVAVDYINGSQEYKEGGVGESGTTSLSLYNTWLGNKGHYLDLVAKTGRMGRDYSYEGDFPDSGASHNWYYSLSAEYGRKIINKNSGWYWEPQTQLTFGHVNGVDYTTGQGIEVNNDAFNSLVWRTGLTIGKHYGKEDGKRSNIYAKAFWNKEFMGDLDYTLDYKNQHLGNSDNYGGTWWTVGIGANTQIGNKTNAYLDVSKNFGGDIARKWQFNVGLRWNWDK